MEIRHRIGIGKNDVAFEHVHQPARYIPDVFLFVLIDGKFVHVRQFVFEFVGGDRLGGGQRVQNGQDPLDEFFRPFSRYGGDGKFRVFAAFAFKLFQVFFRAVYVAFVQRDDLRKRGQLFAVLFELGVDLLKIFVRVAPFRTGNVDDVHEHSGTLDVAQEIVPQPRARSRALDQPRDIRRDERPIVIANHAQIGRKRGEMVIGDLGLCGADFGQEGAFTHVGKADQPHVRDDFEFENEFVRLRFLTLLRKMRRVPPRRGEADVALAAVPAPREQLLFAVGVHVAEDPARFGVAHDGAEGDGKDDVRPALAETVVRAAALAVARLELGAEAVIGEVVLVFVADDVHVAAPAAVAAVRPAVGEAFKTLERVHAVAAVARFYRNFYLVRE